MGRTLSAVMTTFVENGASRRFQLPSKQRTSLFMVPSPGEQVSRLQLADRGVDATRYGAHHLEAALIADVHAAGREDDHEQAAQDGKSVGLPAIPVGKAG